MDPETVCICSFYFRIEYRQEKMFQNTHVIISRYSFFRIQTNYQQLEYSADG